MRDHAGDYDHYIVARLALWAGDLSQARERLQMYRHTADADEGRAAFPFDAAHCADRTLRQLNRRVSEYRTIYTTLGFSTPARPRNILRSANGHLGAAIWVETHREYELRAYLLDLAWEQTFYDRSRRLSESGERQSGATIYGTDQASQSKNDQFALSIEWAGGGPLFIQVAVSDFGTFSARGVWTLTTPPKSEEDIIRPYQRLLDAIDSAEDKIDWINGF